MSSKGNRWHKFCSRQDAIEQACAFISECAKQALEARGEFHLVVTGGRTAEDLYYNLDKCPNEWRKWNVWWGDERCVPADSFDRNSFRFFRSLTNSIHIPSPQLHLIRGELGAENASRLYEKELESVGEFDLVLLSLGDDGHVASLFESDIYRYPSVPVIPVFDSPKAPIERVTLTPGRLSLSDRVLCLALGEQKKSAVDLWLNGGELPARMIEPANGMDIFVDRCSWGGRG